MSVDRRFPLLKQWPQVPSGTTATRPTNGVTVGLSYFDTTLGYPVFLKTISTTTGVPNTWVNASGAVV